MPGTSTSGHDIVQHSLHRFRPSRRISARVEKKISEWPVLITVLNEQRKKKKDIHLIHVRLEGSRPFCRACTLHRKCLLSSRLRKWMHHGLRLRLSEMQLLTSGHTAQGCQKNIGHIYIYGPKCSVFVFFGAPQPNEMGSECGVYWSRMITRAAESMIPNFMVLWFQSDPGPAKKINGKES